MACFVPKQYKHLRWHVIQPTKIGGPLRNHHHFEIAQWVNEENNGPNDRGHWVRWGVVGDFPSLAHATYVGPFPDQEMLDKKMDETKGTKWLDNWMSQSGAYKA